ncbi:hypothetical protein V2G26_010650 [Clonostachys chloroleuca]
MDGGSPPLIVSYLYFCPWVAFFVPSCRCRVLNAKTVRIASGRSCRRLIICILRCCMGLPAGNRAPPMENQQ